MVASLLLKISEAQKLNSIVMFFQGENKLQIAFEGTTLTFRYICINKLDNKAISKLSDSMVDAVVSDSINNSQAKRIADKGLFYFDSNGNSEFVTKNKRHIFRGAQNVNKPTYSIEEFLNPKNEKSASVIYVLLTMKEPLKARQISSLARVSLGLVGRICKTLVDHDLLISSHNGYFLNSACSVSLGALWNQEVIKVIHSQPVKKFISFHSLKELSSNISKFNLLSLQTGQKSDTAILLSLTPNLVLIGAHLGLLEVKEKADIEIIYFPYSFWFSRPEFIQLLNSIQ